MTSLTAGTMKIESQDQLTVDANESLVHSNPAQGFFNNIGDITFTDSEQELFLTRVPRFLWKAWSELEEGDEIQVGTIRIEGDIAMPKRVSIAQNSACHH